MIYQGHYTAIKFTSSHTSSVNSLCISGKIDEEIQFCARNVVQVSKGSVAVIHTPTGLIIYDQAIVMLRGSNVNRGATWHSQLCDNTCAIL